MIKSCNLAGSALDQTVSSKFMSPPLISLCSGSGSSCRSSLTTVSMMPCTACSLDQRGSLQLMGQFLSHVSGSRAAEVFAGLPLMLPQMQCHDRSCSRAL